MDNTAVFENGTAAIENEIAVADAFAVPAGQSEAMDLHLRIKANLEMAATSLLEVCRGLKEMKEGDRYKALGFEGFEDYTETALGIKSRMAYYYISTYDRLGPDLLAENAGLGITKLRLLSEVTPLDRGEFFEDNDLAGMSVEEIREAVKERNGLREQLSMFEEMEKSPDDRELADEFSDLQRERDEALAAKERAEAELAAIAAAEEKEIAVSEENIRAVIEEELTENLEAQIAAAVENARAEAEKERDRLIKAAKKEAKEKAEQAAEKKLAEARAAAIEEARANAKREVDEQLAAVRAEQLEAAARAAELEKKLNVSTSTETMQFSLHFDQIQQHFKKMLEILTTLQEKDDATAMKLETVLETGLNGLKQQLFDN